MNFSLTPALPIYVIIGFFVITVGFIGFQLIKNRDNRRVVIKWVIRLVTALLLGLLLLRPAVPTITELERLGTQIDIIFVVDTTMSMAVEDMDGKPRLEVAKEAIYDLAQKNSGARYSLITFNSNAKTELPLSYDLSALKSGLDTMQTDYYSNVNTGTTTTKAAEILASSLQAQQEQFPERSRVVYYLTDGEDTANEGQYDLTPAAQFIEGGAAVGVGTAEGGPVPIINFDYSSLKLVKEGFIDGSNSQLNMEQVENIGKSLGLESTDLISNQNKLPPVDVKAVDTVIKQVDKKAPAQFEFYWIISLVIIGLLMYDVVTLSRESQTIYRRRKD